MTSPLLVIDVAHSISSWNPSGTRSELEPFVRVVRGSLIVVIAGERGAAVASAAFNHRKNDPQDPEKRPNFDGIPAQERANLAQIAGQVQAEALTRGIITASGQAGIRPKKQ